MQDDTLDTPTLEAPDTTPEPSTSEGNAWDAARLGIGELLEEAMTPPDEAGDDNAGAPPAGAARPAKADASDDPDGSSNPAGTPLPGLTVRGADGAELELDWPEGAVVEFRGDRKLVKVESWDEALTLMKKGAAFDRQGQELGQRARRLENELVTLREASVSRESHEALEALLVEAVFDEAVREQLAPRLERFRDPDARKDASDRDRAAQRDKLQQERERQRASESSAQLWGDIEERFAQQVEAFPYLTEDDHPAVQQTMFSAYGAVRDHLYGELKAALEAGNISQLDLPRAQQEIEAVARDFLTHEDTLTEAMRQVQKQVRQTLAKRTARAGVELPDDEDEGDEGDDGAQDEAERHNARTKKLLDQRRRTRTARGSAGTPPAPGGRSGPVSLPAGTSWNDRMAAINRELETAKRR